MNPTEMTAPKVHEIVSDMIANGNKLLDVGCGEGALINRIKSKFKKTWGCDLGLNEVKLASDFFNKVDINFKFPYDDDFFDVATCTEVIEHSENPFNVIREIHRVLKKDGLLILTTPNVENWYSKLLFLFFSKFSHFRTEKDYYKTGHIEPIFRWKLNILLKDKFKIEEIKFNQSIIPILRWNIPIKNYFFSDVVIMKLRRIG